MEIWFQHLDKVLDLKSSEITVTMTESLKALYPQRAPMMFCPVSPADLTTHHPRNGVGCFFRLPSGVQSPGDAECSPLLL